MTNALGRSLLLCLFLVSPSLLAQQNAANAADAADSDPWEPFNRRMFAFNNEFDRYLLKPAARGYRTVTPGAVDDSVTHFFDNLNEPVTLANDLLQAKFARAGVTTLRFLLNTTVGVLGIFDVASQVGLEAHSEDFGQTLGYWGTPSGPYLVLPFWGPSTVRDGFAEVPDWYIDPVNLNEPFATQLAVFGVKVVDLRADLLDAEKLIMGDRYTFMRDAWLQRREAAVRDGRVKDSFGDEDFGDLDEDFGDFDEDFGDFDDAE